MKKLILFLTLLFVGLGATFEANAQYSPSNNLNYIKLLKTPPIGSVEDSVMVYDSSSSFVKMLPKSSIVAGKESISNKTSTITGYDTNLYPNEKATHDALDLKLNISDLPTNLTLYPTTTTSDVSGYVVMVKDIHDVRYNSTAVDVSTPTITGVGQLISQRISDAGVLIGQPGVFNITTFGNIRHLSGSGTATFYFEVYRRDLAGVETLICTSSTSEPVVNGTYAEFTASGVWDDGDFIATDRIVIKSYANRIAGGSDPVYQFQFGGASPVRTLLPVPFSVVDAGYELKSNKQNDLTPDGTGTKYPTVDAVNTIDLQKVINVGGYAELGDPNSSIEFTSSVDDITDREVNLKIGTAIEVNDLQIDYIRAGLNSSNYELGNYASIKAENQNVFLNVRAGAYETIITPLKPLIDTTLNFPAKTVAGTYTLATTDEISTLDSNVVHKTGDETITGSKTFQTDTSSPSVTILNGSTNPHPAQKIYNFGPGNGLEIDFTTGTGDAIAVFNSGTKTLFLSKEGDISSNSNYIKSSLKLLNSDADLYGDISLNLDRYLFNNKSGNLQFLTQNSGFITYKSPTISGTFSNANLTESRTFTLPDASGTIPIISQTITNGVTDKSPSEDAVFDALANVTRTLIKNTVTGATITGTISQTVLYSQLIPANTFKNGDFFNIAIARIGKIGTAGTLRNTIRVNTTNTVAGSILIADNIGGNTNLNIPMNRIFSIESNNLVGFGASQVASDIVNSSLAIASYAFNPAIDNYIFVCGTLSVATDSMFFSSLQITN